MRTVYITLLFDFCFLFKMIEVESFSSVSNGVSGSFVPKKTPNVESSGTASVITEINFSSSPTLNIKTDRLYELSKMLNLTKSAMSKLSEVTSEDMFYNHHRLTLLKRIKSTLHKKFAKVTTEDNELVNHSPIFASKKSFHHKSEDNETKVSRKTCPSLWSSRRVKTSAPDLEAVIRQNTRKSTRSGSLRSFLYHDYRQLVKRDSSLITEDCGPIGNRCNYVNVGQCLPICINGRRRRICKAQGENNSHICFTYIPRST